MVGVEIIAGSTPRGEKCGKNGSLCEHLLFVNSVTLKVMDFV